MCKIFVDAESFGPEWTYLIGVVLELKAKEIYDQLRWMHVGNPSIGSLMNAPSAQGGSTKSADALY